jgi:peptidoglycan/xylan/chitin deacetylase (PgdA/CDA1 family)
MKLLRHSSNALLHSLGGIRGFRHLNRRGARILMYHQFPPDTRGLRRQCEHIRRYYQPISLSSLTETIRQKAPVPHNALIVTVDDGYRDFLLHAYPVFRNYDIPVTVFLVSDFLDGRLWLWWDQVQYAFRHTDRKSLPLELSEGDPIRFSFETEGQRVSTAEKVIGLMKGLDNLERLRLLKLIPERLAVSLPAEPPGGLGPLSWDEVRRLAGLGVEFGAHTKTHPILSQVGDSKELSEEIGVSKSRLEEELGTPAKHFCYPNGRAVDFNEKVVEAVREHGFHSAVTTLPGLNFAGAHPFLLKRLYIEPTFQDYYFRELLAGVRSY